MKKVLCGLVIALMMTGSGYTQISSKENCDYLMDNATTHFVMSQIAEEGGRVVSVTVAPITKKSLPNNNKERISVLEMPFFQHLEVAKTYLDIYAHICD